MTLLEMDIAIIMGLVLLIIGLGFVVKYAFHEQKFCFRCGNPIKKGQAAARADNGRRSHFGCTMGAIGEVETFGND